MKPTIHFIHGIRDDGTHTTDVLARLLSREGWEVKPHKLLRTRTWHAYSRRDTRLLARSLLHHIHPGDHMVCHSHGNNIGMAILHEAALMVNGPYISKFISLAPAMNRKQHFEDVHFDKWLCIHNPIDFAILFGSVLPFHPFGLAGAMGFRTKDKRVLNEARPSFVGPFNHTAPYFQEPYVEEIAARVNEFLQSDLGA